MTKALLDTTVLADILLKKSDVSRKTSAALKRYSETQLPVYAIKEFKSGPLSRYVWLHNKFVTLSSYSKVIAAIQAESRTPRRYLTSTALEALAAAAETVGRMDRTKLEQYGDMGNLDSFLRDRNRLAIRTKISRAWKRRRKVASRTVYEMPCYREVEPILNKDGLLEIKPKKCESRDGCGLAPLLKKNPGQLEALQSVVRQQGDTPELKRRHKALRQMVRKPKAAVTEEMCTGLGDAVFVLLTPPETVILTTNLRDFEPLVNAVGKKVERP